MNLRGKTITKERKMATQGSGRKLQAKISNCSRDAETIPHCLHRCHYRTSMRVNISHLKSKTFFISVLSGITQHYAVQQREVLRHHRGESRPETSKKSLVM